jgi:hypothetical protein
VFASLGAGAALSVGFIIDSAGFWGGVLDRLFCSAQENQSIGLAITWLFSKFSSLLQLRLTLLLGICFVFLAQSYI